MRNPNSRPALGAMAVPVVGSATPADVPAIPGTIGDPTVATLEAPHGADPPPLCAPGSTDSCHGGGPGSADVGACASGIRACLPDGSAYGACVDDGAVDRRGLRQLQRRRLRRPRGRRPGLRPPDPAPRPRRREGGATMFQRTCRSLATLLGAVVFGVALAPISGEAALPRPGVTLLDPPNAAALYYDPVHSNVTLGYDVSTESILVVGGFSHLPERLFNAGAFSVVVTCGPEQEIAPMVALPGSSTTVGRVTLVGGVFASRLRIPFDDLWPMRPIVAEIRDGRRRVLARSVIHIHDFRSNGEAVIDFPIESTVRGFTAQVTDPGIGYVPAVAEFRGLEPTVFDTLPFPSLTDLNDRLTNRAQDIADYDDDANLLGNCIDLDDLAESNFSDPLAFPAYASALVEAELRHQAYEAQKLICDALPPLTLPWVSCQATLLPLCPKNPPSASDFELCVDQVEGEAVSLSVEGLDDLSLRIRVPDVSDTGRIDADVTLVGLRGAVTGRLRSLFVRWKDPLCLPGIRADLDDAAIPERAWLDEWATCEDLELRNEIASTLLGANGAGAPGRYVVDADPTDVERPLVQLGTEGEFGFELPSVNANRGTCGEPFVRSDVEDMIRTFRTPMQLRLQNTWYRTPPDTPEAQVLTKLLSPLEPGDVPMTDADVVTELLVNHSQPEAGLGFKWDAVLDSSRIDLVRKAVSLHVPPRSPAYSESGLDHHERGFDFAWSITTGLLNKVLNVRAASPETLHGTYAPTWAELAPFGIPTPAGADPEAAAVLDRRTLARFHRAFGSIGRAILQIRVRPVIDPIAWMTADVQPLFEIPGVGAPLAYGMPQFELEFFEAAHEGPKGEPVPEKTWLRLLGNFVDRDFRLRIDPDPAGLYLVPVLEDYSWGFAIVENALRGAFEPTDLSLKVARLVDARFTPVLEHLLSEIPAPKFFDAAGESSQPREFSPRSLQQKNQNVVWYGDFEAP